MKTTNYKSKKIVNQYRKTPLAAVCVFYPALLKIAGNVQNKSILDIGCGSGWFSHKLSKRGARVLALDNSRAFINICKERFGQSKRLKFVLAGCDGLGIVKGRRFDIIFANMLFLSIASRKTVEKAFREIGNAIKRGGTFIFNDVHPLALLSPKTGTKVSGLPRGFSNFKEGFKCRTRYLLADYTYMEFTDAHWSLGFYSKQLKENGMIVEEIIEPKPLKIDHRKKLKDYRIPDYIIFKCRKI